MGEQTVSNPCCLQVQVGCSTCTGRGFRTAGGRVEYHILACSVQLRIK